MNKASVAAFGAVLWAGSLVGDLPATRAQGAEDDLAVVKRAVAQTTTPQPAPQALPDERPAPRPPGARAQWLRVRVTERGGKRVRINMPLSLVRAVSDWPVDFGCGWDGERRRCKLRLSEVLDALDSGQSLVEIDEDGGTKVRVWIE
jgi:hypothetical protein